ncbi:MAG: NfeD family protein [Bacteroidales bacterium]|nr:NfeD family protein [Bacteroidales bacterium]
MNWTIIIITLIVVGVLGLVLEFLLIPGGVVGAISGLAIIAGIVLTYYEYGTVAGNITLIITVVALLVGLFFLLRSRTWRKFELSTKIDSKVNEIDESKVKVGAVGVTVSRLAPGGKANFDGEVVEVCSSHTFIDENQEVEVLKIEGNKITVKLK